MNLIRAILSLFIVTLLISAAAGWRWTTAHQSPQLALASHVVLTLSGIAGVVGLVLIWSWRPGARARA